MNPRTGIVWFRNDLRLTDNPSLVTALSENDVVIPVFIWDASAEGDWPPGAASRWWLHQSLKELDDSLRELQSRLVLRSGDSSKELKTLCSETGATSVYFNRRYEPAIARNDERLIKALATNGTKVCSFKANLLLEPNELANKTGQPFKVFTAFWRAGLNKVSVEVPLPPPKTLKAPKHWPASLLLTDLGLEPKINWAEGFKPAWAPGENGARTNLELFISDSADSYSDGRNRPDQAGTSRLSPHLHFGEISPRQIWNALKTKAVKSHNTKWQQDQFVTELGWREFAYHSLFHFPHTPKQPLRREFAHFPWRSDPDHLRAWQRGKTGYPLVDAGMRELWTTGWMHNRVRMVVGSFLVKNLLQPWQSGAEWFWDTLVDADLANNTLGWQWIAGCGADAAPFFRIFNPVAQGEKFDPNGDYISKWVPELRHMPAKWIHCPSKAPEEVLRAAKVVIDETYPGPIISHQISREVALEAFARMRQKKLG